MFLDGGEPADTCIIGEAFIVVGDLLRPPEVGEPQRSLLALVVCTGATLLLLETSAQIPPEQVVDPLAALEVGAREIVDLEAVVVGHVRAVAPHDSGQRRLQPPFIP